MSKVQEERIKVVRWYLAGFAGLGALVGLFAGLSSSPVVASLLPLLFTLVGGTSGLYLARADANAEIGRWRLRVIGQNLVAFVVACTAALVVGMCLRTGQSPSVLGRILLDGRDEQRAAARTAILESSNSIEILVLRSKLQALGLSETDAHRIAVRELARAESAHRPDRSPQFQKVSGLLDALAAAVRAKVNALANQEQVDEPAQSVAEWLLLASDWKLLSELETENAGGATAALEDLIAETKAAVLKPRNSDDPAVRAVMESDVARQASRRVEWALSQLEAAPKAAQGDAIQRLDELFKRAPPFQFSGSSDSTLNLAENRPPPGLNLGGPIGA